MYTLLLLVKNIMEMMVQFGREPCQRLYEIPSCRSRSSFRAGQLNTDFIVQWGFSVVYWK